WTPIRRAFSWVQLVVMDLVDESRLRAGGVEGHLLLLARNPGMLPPDPERDLRLAALIEQAGDRVLLGIPDLLPADGAGRMIGAVVPPFVLEALDVERHVRLRISPSIIPSAHFRTTRS